MNIHVLNRKEEFITIIHNDEELGGVLSFNLIEDLAELDTLDFEVSGNADGVEHLVEGNYILTQNLAGKWKQFVVTRARDDHGVGVTKLVEAEECITELGDYDNLTEYSGTAIDMNTCISELLSGTRYNVGVIEAPLIAPQLEKSTRYVSKLTVLKSIAAAAGLYVFLDITVNDSNQIIKTVHLKSKNKEEGKRFEFDSDLGSIERTTDASGLKTAIRPLGAAIEQTQADVEAGKPVEYVTIKDVVWYASEGKPVDKPAGEEVLIDPVATEKYGVLGADGTLKPKVIVMQFSEITDPEVLAVKAWAELDKLVKPQVNYAFTATDLTQHMSKLGEGEQPVEVGDVCYAIDDSVQPPIVTEVLIRRIEGNPDQKDSMKVEIGIPETTLVDNIVGEGSVGVGSGGGSTGDGNINSDTGNFKELTAIVANINDLKANVATIKALAATDGNFDTISADVARIKLLEVDGANIATLIAGKADIGTLNAVDAKIDQLKVEVAYVKDLEAANAKIDNLTVNKANITDLNATNITVSNLSAEVAKIGQLEADIADIGTLVAGKADITELNAAKAEIGELKAGKADIGDLNAANANITNLLAHKATIETLIAGNISAENIKAGTITADSAIVASLNASKITAGTLDASKITVTNLNASSITAGTIDASKVNVTNINASNINTGTLDASKVTVSNMNAGAITGGTIDAAKVTVKNLNASNITTGTINASTVNITNLNATNITSGTLNTGSIAISGINGKLRINNNRLQVFDSQATPMERVAIGDVNNDGTVYGLRVRGKDGTTVLYDENGVYEEGITDGAITNDKIGGDAVTSDKLFMDEIFASSAFITKFEAVEITAQQITTGKISSEFLDIEGIISFQKNPDAFGSDMQDNFIFDTTSDKTFINGGAIWANSVTAEKINAKGLKITNAGSATTFQVFDKQSADASSGRYQEGDVVITGTMESANYDPSSNTGYRIDKDGNVDINNATIRGDVILPNAGITNAESTTTSCTAEYAGRNILFTPQIVLNSSDPIYAKSGFPNPPVGAVFSSYNQIDGVIAKGSVSSNGTSWAIISAGEMYQESTDAAIKEKLLTIIDAVGGFLLDNVSVGNFNSMDFRFVDTGYKYKSSTGSWVKSEYKELYLTTIWLQVKALALAYDITGNEKYATLCKDILYSLVNTHMYINNRASSGKLPAFLQWASYEYILCENLAANPRFKGSTRMYANQMGYYIKLAIDEVVRVFGNNVMTTPKGDKFTPIDVTSGFKSYLLRTYNSGELTATPTGLPYGYYSRQADGVTYKLQNWDFIDNTWGDVWFVGDVVCYIIYGFAALGLIDIAKEYAAAYYAQRVNTNEDLLFYDRLGFTGGHLPDDSSVSITYTALYLSIEQLVNDTTIAPNTYLAAATLNKYQVVSSDPYIDGAFPWDVSVAGRSLEFKSMGEILQSKYYKYVASGDKSRSALNPVRFWAGADFAKRGEAPFQVLQDGTVKATRGEFGGTFTGELSIGNIRIADTNSSEANITVHTNNDATKVLEFNEQQAFIGTNLKLGSETAPSLEFDSSNRAFNITKSAVHIVGNNSKVSFPANNSATVIQTGFTDKFGYTEYTQRYSNGTVVNEHNGVTNKDTNAPDFEFKRVEGDTTVKVSGAVDVMNEVVIGSVKIVNRSKNGKKRIDFVVV